MVLDDPGMSLILSCVEDNTEELSVIESQLDVLSTDISSVQSTLEESCSIVQNNQRDLGRINLEIYNRQRPYPYDLSSFNPSDGLAPNTFGSYVLLIPAGTFNFGDTPNRIVIDRLDIEDISANDIYVIEFYRSTNGITFTPLGATRFSRSGPFDRTLQLIHPSRDWNADTEGLYCRLKSANGGRNITFALIVARFLRTQYYVPESAGIWPLG